METKAAKFLHITVFILFSFSAVLFAEDPVYFADANLKAAVEAGLGISDPTAEDMLNLTYLDAGQRSITDLTGLEYAVNLSTLLLQNNRLTNLPLEIGNLSHLNYLYLSNNQLTSIPPEIGN